MSETPPQNALLGAISLQQMAMNNMLLDLSRSIQEGKPRANFACSSHLRTGAASDHKTIKPVTLRWDAARDSTLCKVTVPSPNDQTSAINELIRSCKPHSTIPTNPQENTIYQRDHVHQVAELDPSSFATDFCPYKSGIIENIAQRLLPGIGQQQEAYQLPRVRAELMKLRVCDKDTLTWHC